MAVDEVTSGDDSAARLARYNELTNKASTLAGQHFKLVDEIIPRLDALVENMNWQGVRATRFRAEWENTRAALSGWAGKIAVAAQKLSDEAENYGP